MIYPLSFLDKERFQRISCAYFASEFVLPRRAKKEKQNESVSEISWSRGGRVRQGGSEVKSCQLRQGSWIGELFVCEES